MPKQSAYAKRDQCPGKYPMKPMDGNDNSSNNGNPDGNPDGQSMAEPQRQKGGEYGSAAALLHSQRHREQPPHDFKPHAKQ